MSSVLAQQSTIILPIMTMEECVAPSEAQKRKLIASIERAEKQMDKGQFKSYTRQEFQDKLMRAYHKGKAKLA